MIPIAKPYLTKDEAQSAYETILSGWVSQGPRVEEFEKKFCEYTGTKYTVAVSNWTTGLHLAMIVSGIGNGDEVICPSLSYVASTNSIRYVNANLYLQKSGKIHTTSIRLKLLRQHGMSVSNLERHKSEKIIFEDHVEIGYNCRMTDIQAAVGIRQLKKLDLIIDERRKIALRYIEELKNIECIMLPVEEQGYFSNYQSFSIYLKKTSPVSRNDLMQKLLDKGIATRRGVMTAHRETAYKNNFGRISLPVSEEICDNSIIIPLFIQMSDEEIDHVINSVKILLS